MPLTGKENQVKYLIAIISLIATIILAKTVEIPVTVPINYDLVTVDHIIQDENTNWVMDIEFAGKRGYLMTNVADNARAERFVLSFNGTIFTDAQLQYILGDDYQGFVDAYSYGLMSAIDPVKEKIIDAVVGSIGQ